MTIYSTLIDRRQVFGAGGPNSARGGRLSQMSGLRVIGHRGHDAARSPSGNDGNNESDCVVGLLLKPADEGVRAPFREGDG